MMTDPVAGYINYFSTRGRGTLERALARSGRYWRRIQGILKEEGVPQDLIYLAQSGVWFSSAGRIASGRAWHVAVHGQSGPGLWTASAAGGSMTARTRRRRLAPPPAIEGSLQTIRGLVCGDGRLNSGPGTVQNAVSAPVTPISGNSTGATFCPRKRAITFPSFWP